MLIDPEEVIIKMPPGSAIYSITYRPIQATTYHPEASIDFLVREDSKTIRRLKNPIVVLRTGIITQNKVGLVPVMFKIGTSMEQLFEVWFNYHQTGGQGESIFKLLGTQKDIAFHLYGDSLKVEKSILIPNNIKDYFSRALEKVKELPAWSMSQFDQERERLYNKYPTPEKLWKTLILPLMS